MSVLLLCFVVLVQWAIPALIGGAVLHAYGNVAGFIAGGVAFFALEVLLAALQAGND